MVKQVRSWCLDVMVVDLYSTNTGQLVHLCSLPFGPVTYRKMVCIAMLWITELENVYGTITPYEFGKF